MGWYLTIQEEMRAVGLKGNELLVFALINGYSQEGQGCYYGSLAHLQEVCGISSRQTAISVLKSLADKGLVNKIETLHNEVKYVSYSVSKNWTGCLKIVQGDVQKLDTINKDIYLNNLSIDKAFDFGKSLEALGVSKDVVKQYLKVRKAKKCVNTELAFKGLAEEIRKSARPAQEVIEICVKKSWGGFEAEWLNKQGAAPRSEARPASKFSAMREMRDRNRAAMMGGQADEQ